MHAREALEAILQETKRAKMRADEYGPSGWYVYDVIHHPVVALTLCHALFDQLCAGCPIVLASQTKGFYQDCWLKLVVLPEANQAADPLTPEDDVSHLVWWVGDTPHESEDGARHQGDSTNGQGMQSNILTACTFKFICLIPPVPFN